MNTVLLAGGGLANGLIAWRLRMRRPGVTITMVEQSASLGGNHTWSFHAGDVTTEQLRWLRPLVAHEWPGQRVRFPEYERRLDAAYFSLTSESLRAGLGRVLGDGIHTGTPISRLDSRGAVLGDGKRLDADLVIDGRGVGPTHGFAFAWQKFLGTELELEDEHGLDVPLLMDATVEQHDGYRFVYVLPLSARRVLVEDTYYSDSSELDREKLRERIFDYVADQGWRIRREHREESGVLPIVLDGDAERYWQEAGTAVARAGMRALLFHHTTGYSLPDAVRLADLVAAAPELSTAALAPAIKAYSLARWHEQGFFRLLNRLMFEAARPAERYRTLQHFYRCSELLIGRFYAGRPGPLDPLRILSGRPPVPVGRALGCLLRGPRRQSVPAATARRGL